MLKNKTVITAHDKAIEVLKACSRPIGFFASGLPGGYEALWSRDSMTTSLGAMVLGDKFAPQIKKSLLTLAKNQTKLGQIPNCVGSFNVDRKSEVTYNSIDSSLWFIIGAHYFLKAHPDKSLAKALKPHLDQAALWLAYQDPDDVGILAQQPTMDWQDAFPHKYGYVLNTQALYYGVLNITGRKKEAQKLRDTINGVTRPYMKLYDAKLGYYYPWGWKNHDGDREHEQWFDSLGNILAILTGLATPKIAEGIIKHIVKNKINLPCPLKAIWPPIKPGDKEWHSYFSKCDAREPLHYLNAGIWPFIGGLYVMALVKLKKFKQAEIELAKLAKYNLQTIDYPKPPQYMLEVSKSRKVPVEKLMAMRRKEFNECLEGKTGKPTGEPFQAWTAGSFLLAEASLKNKKQLFFNF